MSEEEKKILYDDYVFFVEDNGYPVMDYEEFTAKRIPEVLKSIADTAIDYTIKKLEKLAEQF